ncbi:hypothetical protein WJX72_000986 [[Myrmecia] bisecta]|uniref:Deacetylase sirtuin-type domain-containing protein n=1 Tax=[Myrmecia] bisecta TaxID=41462 RepID=A0AAW1QEA3_9CHLO
MLGSEAAQERSERLAASIAAASTPEQGSDEPADGAVSASEESESESDDDGLTSALMAKLLASMSLESKPPPPREPLLESFDLKGIASLIKSGKTKRIVCMVGAGISVSAGIPDFRSPGTGLYDNLAKYNLPHATAVFELDYFRHNPRPFFLLAKELFPGNFQPTPTHYFLKLLHDKGLLLRCFSQNIDSLECQTGLPPEAVVAAHGNFDSARCIACRKEHPTQHVRDAVVRGDETCVCLDCGGLVKPDIVFFGEGLPERFFKLAQADLPAADLLIVMGTSLVVRPFALLINQVSDTTPRLLINREKAGTSSSPQEAALGIGFNFDKGNGNYRDALFLGDCDAGVRRLCRLLGWEAELDALIPPRPAGSAAPVANRGTTVTRSRAAAAVTGQQSSL